MLASVALVWKKTDAMLMRVSWKNKPCFEFQGKWVCFRFISVWEKKSNWKPSLVHIPVQDPLHSTTQVKDSESASQYEPNLILGAEMGATVRQAGSYDVIGWELHHVYLLKLAFFFLICVQQSTELRH